MNAWIKRKNRPDEVVNVVLDEACADATLVYNLYTAFEEDYLGRVFLMTRVTVSMTVMN